MLQTFKDGWRLLEGAERRSAIFGLILFCVAALSASIMVGSIFPFLAVLADPSAVQSLPIIARVGDVFGLESNYQYLFALGIACSVAIILSSTLLIIRAWFIERFCAFTVYRISRRLLKHYLSQNYPFFLDHHSGDLATNILSEAGLVSAAFLRPAATLVASTLTAVALIAVLVAVNPVIAFAGLGVIATFYGIVVISCRKLVSRLGKTRLNANQRQFRTISEVIGGIKDVKLTGHEDAYVQRFDEPARTIAETASRIAMLSETPRYVMQTLAFVGIILICLWMMTPETVGTTSGMGDILPALGVLALAAQRLSPEIQTIYVAVTGLRFGAPGLGRLADILGEPADPVPDKDATLEALSLQKEVRLQRVTYAYPKAEHSGISQISCTIKAGERIGIVGSTGAGKTTFADVVLGLLPPQSGVLSVDGQKVDKSNVRNWQRAISYVPQEIFLTDSSIRENIALGLDRDAIDDARVEHCAKVAQVHSFVTNDLPEGYDTPTGERGVRLSGGQRQRIGLARALYRDADLLVLDEATSALDTVTERAVLDGISAQPGSKTIIMIAHRLSTLRSCNRLLVMERGKIVAAGPWDVLVSTSPTFRDLVAHSDTPMTSVAV